MTDEDRRKRICQELAERLATPDGLRTARLLQQAGLLAPPAQPEPAPAAPKRRGPRPISIWQPRTEGEETVWVRPDPGPFGDHYATRKELRRKQAELPLRVAFFGESVAAGYLYAPQLTPAGVLEDQLRAAGGDGNFEVIDLARTNETLAGLLATVRASLQINPDVLVLFAGNNWNLLETPEVSPYAPSIQARQEVAAALRAEGLAGPVRLARERLRASVEAVFHEIALLAWSVVIPVVVVIPEVNLGDWENRQPVPWLPGDGVARWHRLYKEAVGHLEALSPWPPLPCDPHPATPNGRGGTQSGGGAPLPLGEEGRGTRGGGDRGGGGREAADAAEAIAHSLLDLDGGVCPASWRILARARQARGDLAGAAEAARQEVDAARYSTLAFLGAPQATPEVQDLLREMVQRHGLLSVDLPKIFAAHTGSPLPDRRLFLDYCHLTAEGMRVAMAPVAEAVLRVSGLVERPPDWRALAGRTVRVSPGAEATARLGAAIHSAHRLLTVGSKAPLLEHWCAAALEASPGIASTLLDLVETRSAPVPAVLTAAQQRNAASPYRLLLQHGWQWDHLDADVIAAIRKVLGQDAEIDRRLLAFHRLRGEGTELARPPFFFLWEPLERFYPEVMSFEDLSTPAYLRSPWPETSFALLCEADRNIELDLTLRLPPSPETTERRGEVTVLVNGQAAGSVAATERWTRSRLRLPFPLMETGLNRLTLAWPAPPPPAGDPLAAAIGRLELGQAADLHPVLGEIFSLAAKPSL
jgi:lysophospholipase L1-like esterase